MVRHILDELTVPWPPYRMSRPAVVLAMAQEGAPVATPNEQIIQELQGAVKPPEVMPTPAEAAKPVEEKLYKVLTTEQKLRSFMADAKKLKAQIAEESKKLVKPAPQAVPTAEPKEWHEEFPQPPEKPKEPGSERINVQISPEEKQKLDEAYKVAVERERREREAEQAAGKPQGPDESLDILREAHEGVSQSTNSPQTERPRPVEVRTTPENVEIPANPEPEPTHEEEEGAGTPTPPRETPHARAEAAPVRQAEQAVREELEKIKQMGVEQQDRPAALRFKAWRETTAHDIAAWWNGVGAKVAKDKLAKIEEKVKNLESTAKSYSEASGWNAFWGPFKYGWRVLLARRRRDELEVRMNYFADLKARHEDARNEVLNRAAHHIDAKLKFHEARARKYEDLGLKLNTKLDELNRAINIKNSESALDQNEARKEARKRRLELLNKSYETISVELEKVESLLQVERNVTLLLKQLKDQRLRGANPVTYSTDFVRPPIPEGLKTRQKRVSKDFLKKAA